MSKQPGDPGGPGVSLQPRGDRPGGGPSKATTAAKARYLVALRETCSIAAACAAAGRTRWALRHWIKSDPAFAAEEELAREEVTAKLEKEAIRRAMEGVPEPIASGGQIIGERRVYSDMLLKQLLAAADPARFRGGAAVAVQVNVGPQEPYTLRFEGDGRGAISDGRDQGQGEEVSEATPLPEATRGDLP